MTVEQLQGVLDAKFGGVTPETLFPDAVLSAALNAYHRAVPEPKSPFTGRAKSRLCKKGDHSWCANRSHAECVCDCSCHTQRASHRKANVRAVLVAALVAALTEVR